MAGKPRNRLELRRQHEAAEPLDPMEDDNDDSIDDIEEEEEATARRPKKKAKATTKARAKTTRAAKPAARMKVVWVVMSDAYKPVATFEYNQKEEAEAKAAELTAKGKGTHFVQRTKEALPEDAPGIGASIPRTEAAPAKAKTTTKATTKATKARKTTKAAAEEDEDIDDEDENEQDDDQDEGLDDDEN